MQHASCAFMRAPQKSDACSCSRCHSLILGATCGITILFATGCAPQHSEWKNLNLIAANQNAFIECVDDAPSCH